MKIKNLILTALLIGTLVPNADAMKRPRDNQDIQEPEAKRTVTRVQHEEPVINSLLPREHWTHIFLFCAPFANIKEVLNIMYTCKEWYYTCINRQTGQLHNDFARDFFDCHGFVKGDTLTNSECSSMDTSEVLFHAWALEKSGTSFDPLYTSMDEFIVQHDNDFEEDKFTSINLQSMQMQKLLVSLAKKSLNPNIQDSETGNTFLHHVRHNLDKFSDTTVLKILLKFGANPLMYNNDNNHACMFHEPIFTLIFMITDPNGKNRLLDSGKALIHLIVTFDPRLICDIFSHEDSLNIPRFFTFQEMQQIRSFNINLNVQCNQGNTPLHYLIRAIFTNKGNSFVYGRNLNSNQPYDIVCRLLEFGANATIINNDGQTPLDLAKQMYDNLNDEHCLSIEAAQNIITVLEDAVKKVTENGPEIVEVEEENDDDETMTNLS